MTFTKQLIKFLQVTNYVLEQYVKALIGQASARDFFTEVYVRALNEKDWVSGLQIKRENLSEIFPGIEKTTIHTFAEFGSLWDDKFRPGTAYLTSPKEMFTLNALVGFLRPKNVFEIGTFRGWTTANLVLNLSPEQQLVTLDIARQAAGNEVVENLLQGPHVTRINADSFTFDYGPYARGIDLIFVDACHTFEGVRIDTENAFKMLAPKGVIVWHDYNEEMEGVVRYLNELSRTLPLIWIKNTSLVVYIGQ